MIRVLFLIQNLGGGGAERVLVTLVNHMDKSKFDITVRTMFYDGVNASMLDKSIPYSCKHTPCFKGVNKVISYIPARILYKYFVGAEHYDVVIAYMHGVPTKIISGCRDAAKIAWIHTRDMDKCSLFKAFPTYEQAIRTMNKMDAIVGVSDSVCDAFKKKTGITDKVFTKYNANDCDKIIALSTEPVSDFDASLPVILSIGRLCNPKRFDRLIRVSKKLHDDGYKHRLMILGTGGLQTELEELSKQLGIYDYVLFTGFQENPYKYLSRADLFVCSSDREGLSTATTEALILGVPIVTTNVSGATEILGSNNEYGIVTEIDDAALYQGVKEMITVPGLLEEYKAKAPDRAKLFEVESTVGEVERLITEVVTKKEEE